MNNDAVGMTEFERRVEQQFGLKRGVLFAVGVGCVLLGLLSVVLPIRLFGTLIKVVGALLLVSGALKAGQLVLGRRSAEARRRGWPMILCQVALDVAMGVLLINDWKGSVGWLVTLFGLMFLAEGVVLLIMALRAPTLRGAALLGISGLVSSAIGLAIVAHLVKRPLEWAGVFVGIKLISFGATLVWIAWKALRSDNSLVYEACELTPEVAELYAVYFGTAFHLGVYIGDGEVVHYLDDNFVYRVTWEKFLAGRSPEHWTYPDLPPVSPEVVVQTALSEVGKEYKYSLLTFNCEHFAVFCKSGGTTRQSKYAQVAGSLASVANHPILGMAVELNTRAVEWLAFHLGGAWGKRVSLKIRRVGSAVTHWLVTAGGEPVTSPP